MKFLSGLTFSTTSLNQKTKYLIIFKLKNLLNRFIENNEVKQSNSQNSQLIMMLRNYLKE